MSNTIRLALILAIALSAAAFAQDAMMAAPSRDGGSMMSLDPGQAAGSMMAPAAAANDGSAMTKANPMKADPEIGKGQSPAPVTARKVIHAIRKAALALAAWSGGGISSILSHVVRK